MKKRLFICLFFSILFTISYGQNNKFDSIRNSMQQQFNQFANSKNREYADFRDKVNAAYAERMKVSWKTFQLRAAEPTPVRPEPPKPVVKSDKEVAPTKPVPIGKVVKPVETESPQPFQPITRPEKEESPQYSFQFHHTPCSVHLQQSQRFFLTDASESSAAEAWKRMSANGFDIVADDCFRYKEQLSLNDWGYIELTKTLACDFMGKGTNEAVLVQIYLLVQSGYKVRIARRDGQLVPLIPFSNLLYNYSCLLLDGEWYYLMDDEKEGGSYSVFTEKFKGEKTPSLIIQTEPQFAENSTSPRTFASRRFPNATASVSTNKNLIDFYNNYPVTGQWDEYAKASLSRNVKRSLYPVLKKQIAGKSELEAANLLLNFVQTAFKYQTDQEQFGYERPLFGDELFYYPYSDCEDRSILFSILAHDLLRLDVVLLHFPGHLATAVRFTENVSGYYLMIDGMKYVICDPTYIDAPVGDCMPEFTNTATEIVKIYK